MTPSEDRTVDPAREGLEHLQAAAHEMIAAARSMLDAVEEILEDPRAATAMASAFSTVARLVEGAVLSVNGITGGGASEHDDERSEHPRVQRIKVG